MAAMDEFRKEREAMKTAPFKQKLAYFWDYYKWHTIIIVAVIVFGVSMVHNIVTKTDSVLTGVMLNTFIDDYEKKEELVDEFVKLKEIDTDEYHVELNTSYTYSLEDSSTAAQSNYAVLQAIMAQGANGMLDFMTGDTATMVDFAYKGWFTDLRTVLNEEQIEMYEPYFLYVDQAVLDKIQEASNNVEDTTTIAHPDPSKPEEMEKPFPAFIDMSQCKTLTDLYTYEMDRLLLGIFSNAPNPDMTMEFIAFVNEKTGD